MVSALFGLSQGGIVPSYALIVRDYFPAREAGARVSLVLMATVAGMALGGWMSGAIFDLTGSYRRRLPQRHRLEPAQHGGGRAGPRPPRARPAQNPQNHQAGPGPQVGWGPTQPPKIE